jgi:hypothetical protein
VAFLLEPLGELGRHRRDLPGRPPEAMTMWSAMLDLPSSGMVTRSCAWSSSS